MIIAGTGHRPSYCPCKYKENHPWLNQLKRDILAKIEEEKPEAIISGMALGWDMWLAKAALHTNTPLLAYVPYKEHGSRWSTASKAEHDLLVSKAKEVIYTQEEYSNACYIKRDQMMVDDSDKLWALWNTEVQSGGTFITVQMAERANMEIYNFWRS